MKHTIRAIIFYGALLAALGTATPPNANAQVSLLTGLGTPKTAPKRSISTRLRLVDGMQQKSWKGRPGKNTITISLPSAPILSSVELTFQRAIQIERLTLLSRDSNSTFMPVQSVKRVRVKKGESISFPNLNINSSEIRVRLTTSRKRRKRSVPFIQEISLFGDAGTSSPNPVPGPGTPPGTSPTPTPTPSPLSVAAIENASVNGNEEQGASDAMDPSISDDGRYVAFTQIPKGFENGSTVMTRKVYLRDRVLRTTKMISTPQLGGDLFALDATISGNGRYVAYTAIRFGLGTLIFRYDRETDQTEVVSVTNAGDLSIGACGNPQISDNGNFVVFTCFDTNLSPNDNNGFPDVFLRDINQQTTTLVSVNSNGEIANDEALFPSVSNDGNIVVWDSRATNLIPNDTNQTSDVFARDISQGTTFLVSENISGIQGADESDVARISGNGRFVVFQTFAQNLVPGPAGMRAVVRKDLQTGEVLYVSQKPDGSQPLGDNYFPVISDDGRYVAFESDASDLVSGDTNNVMDIFLRDTLTQQTLRMSETPQGVGGNGISSDDMGKIKSLASDSLEVAFETLADNLFNQDLNGARDIAVAKAER